MSHFLADKLKKTITLKDEIYLQIAKKTRRHLALSGEGLKVGDVVELQSTFNELDNSKNQKSAITIWALITTVEVFSMPPRTLTIYGFTSVDELPEVMLDMVNAVHQENKNMTETIRTMMENGVEMV
jgi:hypothetical protein